MTEDIFRICTIDDTITKVNQTCKDQKPDGTGGKPDCGHCLNAKRPTLGILQLIKSHRLKYPISCDKDCLYKTRRGFCCLDLVSIKGHTEENCRYGIKRQVELCLAESGK